MLKVVPLGTHPFSRLRIGYLSSDLHEHATAYLIAEVLEHHDRERFEVFAYSYGPEDGSAMRQRLRTACEHFIDIAREPDDLAARRIASDEIDILLDLKGYTMGDRLTIMAHRPCDIQVTWLGYPGTTGASFIDYLIADPFVIPSDAESFYSERIVRMPHCYQPNDRKRAQAEPLHRADYGLPEHAFVFCCFNQTYKITPEVFTVWMELLRAVPNSILWIFANNDLAKRNLLECAQAHGMGAQRIVFAPRLPNAQHLARYRVADLALDTFPYTSHTTLSDALWCGCPAVALCGKTFAARVSGSLLRVAGLPELVTHTLFDYEQLAVKLARDPQRLSELRARIAQARDNSPLFDSAAFTRDLEGLYAKLVSGG
jgi:predicted O-linked N-acetylglucosamine transferase (SPINDLY family)